VIIQFLSIYCQDFYHWKQLMCGHVVGLKHGIQPISIFTAFLAKLSLDNQLTQLCRKMIALIKHAWAAHPKLNNITRILIYGPLQKFWDHTCCHRLQSTARRGLVVTFPSSFGARWVQRFAAARHAAASSVAETTAACTQVASVLTGEWMTTHYAAVIEPLTMTCDHSESCTISK